MIIRELHAFQFNILFHQVRFMIVPTSMKDIDKTYIGRETGERRESERERERGDIKIENTKWERGVTYHHNP